MNPTTGIFLQALPGEMPSSTCFAQGPGLALEQRFCCSWMDHLPGDVPRDGAESTTPISVAQQITESLRLEKTSKIESNH